MNGSPIFFHGKADDRQEQGVEKGQVTGQRIGGIGDFLMFGPETRGLPEDLRNAIEPRLLLRVPMRPGSRSINLSNTVALAAYEAWRQMDFPQGA